MMTIIAAVITGSCTLIGVVVTNEMQLRRQTRQLAQQAGERTEGKP